MRLWSLHPRHLDRQGLVACWREALLAQAVLDGRTTGYRRHPQLERFRSAEANGSGTARELVSAYLLGVAAEADRRGYRFDRTRVLEAAAGDRRLPVTTGQLEREWAHLLAKLEARSPDQWRAEREAHPTPHPLFEVIPGPVADWERSTVVEARSHDGGGRS
ncbi:MAG TPA: pyrimidine dimer DNA glycosylase/endonuclease V [Microbacteriaceae bacterium]|nr:pyrimidine dimer DNA glycosylase/endonuclease V [Microbacteriaceae bacterium]